VYRSEKTAAAFHPGGATVDGTNQFSQSVSIVDVATNAEVGTLPVNGSPFAIWVSPDGAPLWVTANTDSVFVIELATEQLIASIPVDAAPNGIAFHPTDSIVYVSAALGGTVHEISTASHTVLRTFAVGGIPQGLAVSADGSELYIANEASGLQVWDAETGASITTVALGGGGFGLALSPDGARLAVTQPALGRMRFVSRAARTIFKTVITGGQPRRVAFAADGSVVVVPNEGGWFDVIRN
jgi:YVTN family beta-propeller protein